MKQGHVATVTFRAGNYAGIGDIIGDIKEEHKDLPDYSGATRFQFTGNIGDEGLKAGAKVWGSLPIMKSLTIPY